MCSCCATEYRIQMSFEHILYLFTLLQFKNTSLDNHNLRVPTAEVFQVYINTITMCFRNALRSTGIVSQVLVTKALKI